MSVSSYFKSVEQVRPGWMSRFGDVILTGVLVAIIALMIVPLPIFVIDTLVAVNIAVGGVLLLLAIYIGSPLEFSAFPSVLLVTTLFRLALAIATTRMILLHGDAGHIIDTFGRMVAGGNLVVGMVVFLIITVVQFIVIAKGAERVAEVAARFSLDAMPGKQLSIDSDLRAGLIDKDEARRRRKQLELESKLHGSMDGAMKFVKGDSIAGIIIIVINLLGGLAVGVMQQGMSLADAVLKFSILTIGDGMVSQIPALLGAMSAGLIVTRTADSEGALNLGDAIGHQIASKPRVLLLSGGLAMLMAAVPGFPAWIFVLLAALFIAAGVWLTPDLRQRLLGRYAKHIEAWKNRPQVQETAVLQTQAVEARATVPLMLEIPEGSFKTPTDVQLIHALEQVLDHFQLQLGVTLPKIVVHRVLPSVPEATQAEGLTAMGGTNFAELARNGWRLWAHEVPLAKGQWGPAQGEDPAVLADEVKAVLRRHVNLFLGTQETTHLMTRATADYPDLVRETMRALPVAKVAEIFRRLIEEGVAIRNIRDILETLAEAAQREKDVGNLAEFVRLALRRQLSYQAAPTGHMRALLLEPALEEVLRTALRFVGGVQQVALDPERVMQLTQCLSRAVRQHQPHAIVCAADIRRQVRKLIEHEHFDTPVLSYHELEPSWRMEAIERVGEGDDASGRLAA